jgi:hypothetical protein
VARQSPRRPHLYISSAREEVPKAMKAACHNPVGAVESLFNAITVMDIYINVKYTRMYTAELARNVWHQDLPKEFENAKIANRVSEI